jgi:hypothetical protein
MIGRYPTSMIVSRTKDTPHTGPEYPASDPAIPRHKQVAMQTSSHTWI